MNKKGELVWHHGDIIVEHSFASSLEEVIQWCGENPSELVLMVIWDCMGDGCDAAVASALQGAGVNPVTSCTFFANLTLAEARRLGALPNGGQLLAITAPAPPLGEPSCSYSNYLPSNACSGFGRLTDDDDASSEAETMPGALAACLRDHDMLTVGRGGWARAEAIEACARVAAASLGEDHGEVYRCYDGDATSSFPLDRMYRYLDATSAAGWEAQAVPGQLWQMQGIWQESAASVVLGTVARSSLVEDEARSSLNSKIAQAVASNLWAQINLLEVNDVCNGGLEIASALSQWRATSRR